METQSVPSFGKMIRYSVLHCGHRTLAVLLPRCFSSTHRCKHIWWTQRLVPRHRHGLTHNASRSSSSDAKQTQHVLCHHTRTDKDRTFVSLTQSTVWLDSLTVTCRTCNPEVTQGCRFDSAPGHCRVTTLGKLFTHVPLSPSSIIWYRSKGGDVPRLGR